MGLLELVEGVARGDASLTCVDADGSRLDRRGSQIWGDAGRVARAFPVGRPVGALLTNTIGAVTLVAAAIQAGARLVSFPLPAPGDDPFAYLAWLDRSCGELGVAELHVEARYAGLLGDRLAGGTPVVVLDAPVTPAEAGEVDRDGFSLVQFSSGTTGVPTPMVLDAAAIAANLRGLLEVLDPGRTDVLVSWLPLSHDMGLIGTLLTACAAAGPDVAGEGKLVLVHPERFARHPRVWIDAMSEHRATITAAPPTAYRNVTALAGTADLSSLRIAIVGAELIAPSALESFSAAFAPTGFADRAFCPAYGLAEVAVAATMVCPADRWRVVDHPAGHGAFVACGEPLPGIEVRAVPADEHGGDPDSRIHVRSPSVATGLGGPLVGDDGWLATNDSGFLDGGELVPTGRCDDVIVLAGTNIPIGRIEAELLDHAGQFARRVAIIGTAGGYEVVVESAHRRPAAADMRSHLDDLGRLARERIGARPRRVVVIERGSMPRTPSGKLRRSRLAEGLRRGSLAILDAT